MQAKRFFGPSSQRASPPIGKKDATIRGFSMPSQSDRYLRNIYVQGDRIMLVVVWLICLNSLALGSWYDTWQTALLVSIPLALLSTAAVIFATGSLLARLTNATVFMCLAAAVIHQGHGMIELHFAIFCLLAFLLYYRDWKPLVAASVVVAVHHLLFDTLNVAACPFT